MKKLLLHCKFCLALNRTVAAAHGNVLVDGQRADLCEDHYRLYRKAASKGSRDSGEDFELWIEQHHKEALRLGIVAGEVVHNEAHTKMIHGRLVYERPGVADYTGILYDGHATTLGVEAKKRARRLQRSEVKPKQTQYLDAVVRGGGLAFLLVRLLEEGAQEFAVPWQSVPWKLAKSAEGVSTEDLQPWRIPAERTCYLEPYCLVRGTPATVAAGRRIFPRE